MSSFDSLYTTFNFAIYYYLTLFRKIRLSLDKDIIEYPNLVNLCCSQLCNDIIPSAILSIPVALLNNYLANLMF